MSTMRDLAAEILDELTEMGIGSDEPVEGADAVDYLNNLQERLAEALDAERASEPAKPCPICREIHTPRPMSFDGCGINSCGMYRDRIATFERGAAAHILGPMFAAAPQMADALLWALSRIEDDLDLDDQEAVKAARAAVSAALGGNL